MIEMRGTLVAQRVTADGRPAIRVLVRGNVGAEGRAKLTVLGMTPVLDISNCRERIVTTDAEFVSLRDALVAQSLVITPNR